MALRLHWVPILPSTFFRDKHPQALTLQHKPSSQKPISVSSSSLFFFNSDNPSRKCRNLLVFQVPCSTQAQSNSSTTIEETEENVEQAQSNSSTTIEETEENETRTRVLAQNVPWAYTVDDVRNLFQKYGTVVDIELAMYDKTKNRGLAFVTMGSAQEASAALTNLQSYEVEGRVLRTEYARTQERKEPQPVYTGPKFTVFVGNLSWNVTSANLREHFGSNVVEGEVLAQKENKPIGCGFVSFSSKEEALAAIRSFDGKMFMGRPLRVEFIKKKRKGELKKDIKEPTEPETSTGVSSGGLSENVV